MPVTNDWQIQIVLEGIRRTNGGEPLREQAPPKGRRDLDVTEGRGVEVDFARLQNAFNLARVVRFKKVFDKRRGIDDDDPQEASLSARSLLISSAAGSPRSTWVRRAIRSKTS